MMLGWCVFAEVWGEGEEEVVVVVVRRVKKGEKGGWGRRMEVVGTSAGISSPVFVGFVGLVGLSSAGSCEVELSARAEGRRDGGGWGEDWSEGEPWGWEGREWERGSNDI